MDNNRKPDQKFDSSPEVPKSVNLTPSTSIDLSWLTEEERKVLLVEYASGMMNLGQKAQEMNIDAMALKKVLDDFSQATQEASEGGNSITIAHTQTTSIGRTEIMMGNTEHAQSGKLSKSQTGEKDWKPYYIFGGIVAFIVVIALIRN